MSTLQVGEGSSQPIFPLSSAKKWCVTALVATALVAALIGVAYGVCGYTPLAQIHHHVFLPLSKIGWIGVPIEIACCTLVSAAAVTVLILLHKKRRVREIESDTQKSLEAVQKSLPDNADNINAIKKVLTSGYSSYLDYYGFYYNLACITEKASLNTNAKAQWTSFLNAINGKKLESRDGVTKSTINCSIELQRLEGKTLQIDIEELKRDHPRVQEDLQAIARICNDAFSEFTLDGDELKDYFFGKRCRPFVMRGPQGQVLGVVVLQENVTSSGTKQLYIHTLARSAPAVKMGMTEKLKEYFLKNIQPSDYEIVWCEVRADNNPAQYIYEKLGFQVAKKHPDKLVMVYQPDSQGKT